MEEVWLKFEDRLRAFILSKVHDRAATDDIVQELFIKVHANIDKVRDKTKIRSWMYQVCRNLIADYHRSESKKPHTDLNSFNLAVEDDAGEAMNEALLDMVKMLDILPAEYCEALCLTELGSLSQKQYAEKAGISYSGAKSRIQRARKMLKDMLMICCHYEFDKYGTVTDIHPRNCCCCMPK